MPGRLVLLHGFTGSPATWDQVVARLPSHVDVLAPSLTGHDPSDPAAGGDDFPAEVSRLRALVDAWCAGEPVHLAGYSLGARVGLTLATEAPALFASATLIGVNPGLASEVDRRQRRAADQRWIDLLEDGIEPFVDAWQRLPLWASQARLPADRRTAQREARLRHDPGGLQRSLRALGLAEMPDLRPRLPLLGIPVDLMAGAEDPKFLALAEETASLLPRAQIVVVPDAGHNLVLERPEAVADQLNRKVR